MAFSPIQHQNYAGASGGPNTFSFPSPSTFGTFLCFFVTFFGITTVPAAPPGWTLHTTFSTTPIPSVLGLYYINNNPGNVTGITIPVGPYTAIIGVFGEFAGVLPSSYLDQAGVTVNSNGIGNTGITITATGANAGAGDLVLVATSAGGNANPETVTVTSSTPTLTQLDAWTNGTTEAPVWVGYGTSGAASETDTAVLASTTTDEWHGILVTLKAATITAPTVVTGTAVTTTPTSTTLVATVNPNQGPTTYKFNWGLTSGYGNTTATQNILGGSSTVAANLTQLNGLTAGTTYHFQISATNSAGTSTGSDATFTTAAQGADWTPYLGDPSWFFGGHHNFDFFRQRYFEGAKPYQGNLLLLLMQLGD